MNDNNHLRIFATCAFLAFAAVSCWATAESLHLLLPTWPVVFCWAITIGFFFIASWGTKMIADSLNQDVYMEKRGLNLIGGIIIVLVFWLLCSMPTNTHTFFFRNLISEKVTKDLATTQGYLAQIKDGTVTEAKIQARITEFKNKVEIKMGELEAEIKNDARPGFGEKARDILNEFATMLEVDKIVPLTYNGVSKQDREKLCNAYRAKIFTLRDVKIRNIISEMTPSDDKYKKVAEKDWNNLEIVKKGIESEDIVLTDAEDVSMVCKRLNEGYSTIKMYDKFVDFKNLEDKENYTSNNPQTKVTRLLSVYDVWVDFIQGKAGGLAFIFWIIVSILVDVAAFIFFDIAFKKEV